MKRSAEDRARSARQAARKALAARVSAALRATGIETVLVGGSVVSIYSDELYATNDLDFVCGAALRAIEAAIAPHGWRLTGNRATHPAEELYLQFCAPPLAVGREPVKPVRIRVRGGSISTLSATDCVLDRLMKYYHWDDEQGLEQAVLVGRRREIDLQRIRAVSSAERMSAKYGVFVRRLRGAG